MTEPDEDSTSSSNTITNKDELQKILSVFPEQETKFAIGYGSGVFINEDSMIDLILSVSDVTKWHEKNLLSNADHYASLPMALGPNFITSIQSYGAGCYFNPMVKIKTNDGDEFDMVTQQRLVKYGVISQERLKTDLKEWDSLYIAGRMQKPTVLLETTSGHDNADMTRDEIIHLQEEYNLRYAVSSALLLLPHQSFWNPSENDTHTIRAQDIFRCIAGLSYIGDPRMTVGAEDPNKVKKLVSSNGQYERFHSLYENQFTRFEKLGLLSMSRATNSGTSDFIEINLKDPAVMNELYSNLPQRVQSCTEKDFLASFKSKKDGQIPIVNTIPFADKLTKTLGKIIRHPARIQSFKGIVTAGVAKSAKYLGAKLSKGILKN